MDERFTPQAIWGRELRFYRERAGLTQTELAQRIKYSDSLISSIETGQAPATEDFAKAADRELDTDGALSRLLDWRKAAPPYPSWFVDWIPAEEKAVLLRSFEVALIPGLLQTSDYARALLYGVEKDVEARIARQAILARKDAPPVRLFCVLDEAALHRDVGARADRPGRDVQVGGPAGPHGPRRSGAGRRRRRRRGRRGGRAGGRRGRCRGGRRGGGRLGGRVGAQRRVVAA